MPGDRQKSVQSTPSASPRLETRISPSDQDQRFTSLPSTPSVAPNSHVERPPRRIEHSRSISFLRESPTDQNAREISDSNQQLRTRQRGQNQRSIQYQPARPNVQDREELISPVEQANDPRLYDRRDVHEYQQLVSPIDEDMVPRPLRTSRASQSAGNGRNFPYITDAEIPRSAPPTQADFSEDVDRHLSSYSEEIPQTRAWEGTNFEGDFARRKSAFQDEVDVGLLAAALSGLGDDINISPSNSQRSAAPSGSLLRPQMSAPVYATTLPRSSTSSLHSTPTNRSIRSTRSRVSELGPAQGLETRTLEPSTQMPMRSAATPTSAEVFSATTEHMPPTLFLEALQGVGDEGNDNNDDELPSYAESQREAAEQARRAALSRAAELESRWAASAYRRR